MRQLLALSFLLLLPAAHAAEYGNYDPQRILTERDSPTGKKHGLDGTYLDTMIADLARHAANYPPRFDTPQDKARAIRDVRALSGMLDIAIDGPTPNPELLSRAGQVNSIGYNLDISGSAEKTNTIFQRLLTASPGHARGNYLYGTFLAGAGQPKQALPYLEKALGAGVVDAGYALGMTWLTMGDKTKALEYLEAYRKQAPGSANIDKLIDAVRNGKVEAGKGTD
ncbi:MAG: tetratricopeptide repeat protein [Gammaproteobacteria bacterium]|nr:tetratricopeptide repeat protein [Gammaproteobacteria bacterium]MBU1413989.1 tetratricopeptide repeat protein [Gammaproteobacteria bacterium]